MMEFMFDVVIGILVAMAGTFVFSVTGMLTFKAIAFVYEKLFKKPLE